MQREVVLVLGKTGSGKTTWARNFIQNKTRVILVDAGFGDYHFEEASTFSELCDKVSIKDGNGRGFFRVSYTPLSSEFPFLFDLARVTQNCWLVLEEADRIDGPEIIPEYDEVVSRGRHYGVSILAISLYPYKIPAQLRRQATRIISFRQHEPADLRYLREIMGDDAEQLVELPRFQYVDWNPTQEEQISIKFLDTPTPVIVS